MSDKSSLKEQMEIDRAAVAAWSDADREVYRAELAATFNNPGITFRKVPMTSPDDTPQPTEADREAAMQPEVSRGYTQRTRAKVLRGEKDEDELVQAFARHAQQAREEEREAARAKIVATIEDSIPMPGSLMQQGTPAEAVFTVAKIVRNLSLKDNPDAE